MIALIASSTLTRCSGPTTLPEGVTRFTPNQASVKPLGRVGVAALDTQARAALADGSRYQLAQTAHYGPDTLRRWERL